MRVFGYTLALALILLTQCRLLALADSLNFQPRMPPKERLTAPKDLTLEDLFPRSELAVIPASNYQLEGTRIPGLTDKTVRQLGVNNFIVISNSQFQTFADVYRDNRLRGKPGFVTADCIVHPYFAFCNGITAGVIAKLAPDLQTLLTGMFNSAAAQYRVADEAGLRTDIEKNTAFLTVALKLLNPALPIASVGKSTAMAEQELLCVQAGKSARSVIFERTEDYSVYRPLGWFAGSPQFANFYRCHTWLTHNYFTLNDAADAEDTSEFRRSALLFQNLQQAKVGNEFGLAAWLRLSTAFDTVGTRSGRDRLLLPKEYATVFPAGQKLSLSGLSDPFYRTKLLLSLRRQRPVEVGAASIFSHMEQKASADTTVGFRLFPPTTDIELDFLRERSHAYTVEGADGPDNPLALMDLYVHGAAQASNLLADNIWHLDQALVKLLPGLVKEIKSTEQNTDYSMGLARWQILSAYFKPFPDGAEPSLRSPLWLDRHLESAFAAWLDGHLSVAPLGFAPPKSAMAQAASTAANSDGVATPALFQYLEPCPEVFRKISTDAEQLTQQLTTQGLLTDQAKEKLTNFQSLGQRLASIADREIAYKPLSAGDLSLLSNIDQVLEKVSYPVQGTLNLNTGTADNKSGCTLGLGRPGYLHVMCHTTKGMMLCRGAVYTYYEIPGGPIKAEHWDRKLQYALIRGPAWTSDFDVIQEAPSGRTAK